MLSTPPVTNLFAGIPVADRDAALPWYEGLAGRPPDLVPNAEEAAWQVTDTGWIYIYEDAQGAGSTLNTLLVENLDELAAELAAREIDRRPVETLPNGVRTMLVTDPDGNRLKFGQVARAEPSES